MLTIDALYLWLALSTKDETARKVNPPQDAMKMCSVKREGEHWKQLDCLDPEHSVPLVKAGLLSDEVFAQARASVEHFSALSERFIMLLWLMACGEKP